MAMLVKIVVFDCSLCNIVILKEIGGVRDRENIPEDMRVLLPVHPKFRTMLKNHDILGQQLMFFTMQLLFLEASPD